MQVEVLTLRYDTDRGQLDGATLRAFTRDKIVLSVTDHFFTVGTTPHLALVIQYRLPPPSQPDGSSDRLPARRTRPTTDDLRTTLDSAASAVFDLLRAWRSAMAQDEALPAYAILTNAQLAALASDRPTTRAAVMKVPGLGKKKAERYANDIVRIVQSGQTREATT